MDSGDDGALLDILNDHGLTPFSCLELLKRHRDNIGAHHEVVRRLRRFPYDELEFFIPQFVQLLVAYETNSMALEDFLVDYCTKFPHFSLIVFWNLQAHVFELRNDPDSYSFQVVRRFINQLQDIIFGSETAQRRLDFRENIQPSLILCASIASSIATPWLSDLMKPVLISQGKQLKSFVFKLASFRKNLTKNLTMKNQQSTPGSLANEQDHAGKVPLGSLIETQESNSACDDSKQQSGFNLSVESESYATDDETGSEALDRSSTRNSPQDSSSADPIVESEIQITSTIKSKRGHKMCHQSEAVKLEDMQPDCLLNFRALHNKNSQSLPDLHHSQSVSQRPYLSPAGSESALALSTSDLGMSYKEPLKDDCDDGARKAEKLLKLLRVNYAKKETNFIMSLQNISLRLSQVPKAARLSALRAELSILNSTLLPSEIDIPQLLPFTSNKNRYHKILKLNVNEACVLNSAERVPYLLLIEFLSDEFDFDPFSEENRKVLEGASDCMEIVQPTIHDVSFDTASNVSQKTKDVTEMGEATLNLFPSSEQESDLSDLPFFFLKDNTALKPLPKKNADASAFSNKLDNLADQSVPGDKTTKDLADQMRIASVMLQQLEKNGKAGAEQAEAIKARLIQCMISLQDRFETLNYNDLNSLQGSLSNAGERKLENDFKLGEDWDTKKRRIRKSSAYGHLKNWDLCSVIAKNGDDLPQEAFACQLITIISNIWKRDNINAWTKRMKILITSAQTGLVETISNAISIHLIKKSLTESSMEQSENGKEKIYTLLDYFSKIYGNTSSAAFKGAQMNFARSLAAYSIICYVLQIKDRHNGNIMLDNEGHIIHIDFGFLLSNSPGSMGFEAAPFKLTGEYVALLGGPGSHAYSVFVSLCKQCFNSLRAQSKEIIDIVELMQKDSNLPCFKSGPNTSVLLESRLQLHLSNEESDEYVESILIGKSLGSMYTRLYDQYQMITQGIYI